MTILGGREVGTGSINGIINGSFRMRTEENNNRDTRSRTGKGKKKYKNRG